MYFAAGIDMDDLFDELTTSGLVYMGTEIAFSSIAIDVTSIASSSVIYFDSLTTIPLVDPLALTDEAFDMLNDAIDMYCAADLGLPADEIQITIWLQEEINVDG